MGCGCKTINSEPISGSTIEKKKFSFKKENLNKENIDKEISTFLIRKNKFSFIGLFLFVLLSPVIITLIVPIIGTLFFNKIVLGKDTDLVSLIAYKKHKKIKE